jgi:hypothetical protein
MMREFKVARALGAFAIVSALACGGGGIKTIQSADGQVTTCSYGGKIYNPGDSFREHCNTCSCGGNGQFACTLLLCISDAGSDLAPDAALPDAQADGTVPLDLAKDAKLTVDAADVTADLRPDLPPAARDVKPAIDVVDVLAALSPDLPPAADSARDALLVTDTAKDSQLVVDASDVGGDARQFCVWGGDMVLAIGQSLPKGDGCNTCTCTVAGMACTASICVPPPDAAAPVCSLPYSLTFGSSGGMVLYQDGYSLDGGGHMTVTRTYTLRAGMDGPQVRSCSPTLPACGTPGVVSISTIAQDLTSTDVQAAFALTTSHVYGVDNRPVDGTVWSIARASGGNILVGSPCPSPVMSSCQPIPPGIQRLADDLKSLSAAVAASPACAGL